MEQNLTYSAAYEELENIALEMENEAVSIDELAVRVKRAAVLIDFCQKKLRSTEKEVAAIMAGMEESKTSPAKPHHHNNAGAEEEEAGQADI